MNTDWKERRESHKFSPSDKIRTRSSTDFLGCITDSACLNEQNRTLGTMSQHFHTKKWQVVLPDSWRTRSGRNDDKFVTLWNPEGVGQLRVITTSETKTPSLNGWSREFTGKLQGKIFELSAGNLFVRNWALLCGSDRIYVRYSCATKNAEVERAEVDEIVQSISEAS